MMQALILSNKTWPLGAATALTERDNYRDFKREHVSKSPNESKSHSDILLRIGMKSSYLYTPRF